MQSVLLHARIALVRSAEVSVQVKDKNYILWHFWCSANAYTISPQMSEVTLNRKKKKTTICRKLCMKSHLHFLSACMWCPHIVSQHWLSCSWFLSLHSFYIYTLISNLLTVHYHPIIFTAAMKSYYSKMMNSF